MGKRIITETDILRAVESGKNTLPFQPNECIITPQAMDKAEELGVTFGEPSNEPAASACGAGAECPAPAAQAGVAPAPAATNLQGNAEVDNVVQLVCSMLKERLPEGTNVASLEAIVRSVVISKQNAAPTEAAAVASADSGSATMHKDGVCFIEGNRVGRNGDSSVEMNEQVFLADVIGGCDNAELAGGFMEWERASFSRTVECSEIGIVVSGELHLTIGGETIIGKPGDMVYFPKGVNVLYSTPSSVRIACVNNIQ